MTETIDKIKEILSDIKDPEIPVITIAEMGILRDVQLIDNKINIIITPTYSGCPAMHMIKTSINKKMLSNGYDNFDILTQYTPAWTTDWMSDETLQKFRDYGIAPPESKSTDNSIENIFISKNVHCPHCGGDNTRKQSDFGSTPCKSLYYCIDCEEPFEHFKCH